jgi:DNA-binding MarR family transcriptional regulator
MDPDDQVERARELRVAVGLLARRMRRLYAVGEASEASFTEVAVLVRLARAGPTTPTELANHEQVTSQAIAAVVRELERRALVSRSPHPDDGRRVVITITAAGHEVLRGREQLVMSALTTALGESFTDEELRRLDAAIPLLDRLAATI